MIGNRENSQKEPPLISVVIPAHNEEGYLARCLDSLLAQDYPQEKVEIIVVDGMSTDRTREIASSYARTYPNLKVITNPKRVAPVGLNIGVREAQGEFIARLDAHSWVENDYLSKCLTYLKRSGEENVGGPVIHIGENLLGKAVALASQSRFGLGGAKFRRSQQEEHVDTVFPGFFQRSTIEHLGFFDEDLLRNQDIAFNFKIRKNGGNILLTPAIKVYYYTRPTVVSLLRQNFLTGYWNVKTALKYPGSLSQRHFVPLLFVGSLLLSFLLALLMPARYPLLVVILAAYFISALSFAFSHALEEGTIYFFLLLAVFPLIHFSYGLGSLWGIISLPWRGVKR